MSTISASTTSTTGFKVTSDTTGTLVFQTGASPTTAMSISSAQIISFTNPPTATGGGSVATNTAYGTSALAANTTGSTNTAVGYQSSYTSTVAVGVTSIGYQANYNMTTTGNTYSTAVGYQAAKGGSGSANYYDVAIGAFALTNVTSGANNTAVGYGSLQSTTTGYVNTAVGYQAAYTASTVPEITAIGYRALYSTTVGYSTAVGSNALQANTTGTFNVALGREAGYSNTTGSNNTFIGYQSLTNNTTASYSVAVGYQAGNNSTGGNNTLVGSRAGYSVSSGSGNTFIGPDATGYWMTTGSNNVIIGGFGGYGSANLDIRTSNNYIVLSDGAGYPRQAINGSGQSDFYGSANVVGARSNSAAGTSNRLFFGTYSATGLTDGTTCYTVWTNGNVVNTNNSYGAISDIKLKENITDATPKLAQLCQVRVVNYNFKEGQTQKQLGVIAQELEQVFPSMVEESPDVDAEGNDLGTTTKSVKYSVFVPMLIKAIQEQQAIIETLTNRITALEAK